MFTICLPEVKIDPGTVQKSGTLIWTPRRCKIRMANKAGVSNDAWYDNPPLWHKHGQIKHQSDKVKHWGAFSHAIMGRRLPSERPVHARRATFVLTIPTY